MPETHAYVGIGSNIDPGRHIPEALAELDRAWGPIAVSPFYRSAAVGFTGPDFVNGVVRLTCSVNVDTLADTLKSLERRAGRQARDGHHSRELDLDLLLFGDRVLRRGKLVLPRPDILKYAFVLRPLAEIAPTAIHPETGHDYAWHWSHFQGEPLDLQATELPGAASYALRSGLERYRMGEGGGS